MASTDLCHKKILAFPFNQINHIIDNTTIYQRIFSFGRLPKPLKEIHIIFAMFLGGTRSRLTKRNNLCLGTSAVGQ